MKINNNKIMVTIVIVMMITVVIVVIVVVKIPSSLVKIPSSLKLRSLVPLLWVSKSYGANDDSAADGPLSKPCFSSNMLILSRSSL